MNKLASLKYAVLFSGLLAGGWLQTAWAQDFPCKNIQLLVGNAPGGPTDLLARVLGNEARKPLGVEVIVVNKPGAGGTLAVGQVASAKPDGCTLALTPSNAITTAHFLQDSPADLLERTTALLTVGGLTPALFVRGDSPYRSLKDLIEHSRAKTQKVSIGTPGAGTNPDLVMQAVALHEKIKFDIVPFRGAAPALTALLGGHVTAVGSSVTGSEQHVESGSLRILASLGDERLSSAPNAPTLAEQGFPYSAASIFYILGPKDLPDNLARRLNDAFAEGMRSAAYQELAKKNGISIKPQSGEALHRFLAEERSKTGAIVKALGLGKK